MNKSRKLINAFLASIMLLSNVAPVVMAAEVIEESKYDNVMRLGGKSRVGTSVAVSEEAYKDENAKNVVVAGYNGQADALTGTLLARAKNAPLLLVSDQASHIAEVKAEIKRLGAENVFILGGAGAVSENIATALSKNYNINRVKGHDRVDTAVEIAKEVANGQDKKHIFLTNDGRSGSLADALATGPVSGKHQMPVLLTAQDYVPKATLDALKELGVEKVTIVGGEVAVGKAVEQQLNADYSVDRIKGGSRFETAETIAETYFAGSEKVVLANDGRRAGNGEIFADALVGGYLGAKADAPILLNAPNRLNKATTRILENTATSFAYILGGTGVVTSEVEKEVSKILTGSAEALELEEAKAAAKAAVDALELETDGMTEKSVKAAEAKLAELKTAAKDTIDELTTVTVVEAYEFDATEAEELLVEKLVVESVSSINDIEVVFNGTYKLPLEVEVILSDNKTVTVPVAWDDSAVKVNKAETYQVVGMLDVSALGNVAETDLTASVNVVIAPHVEVENILLSDTEFTLTEEENFALSATVLPENATSKTLSWSSSDESIATVNEHGVVQANSAGEAIITVTDTLENVTKHVGVTVKKPTIDSIEDITIHISQHDAYTLPNTVTALMSNGTEQKHTINWEDDKVDTSIFGNQYFEGTVEGYEPSITLTLVVKQYDPQILTNSYSAITINGLSKRLNLGIDNNGIKSVNIEKIEIYENGRLYTTYTPQRLTESGISTVVHPKERWGISISSKLGIWIDNSYVKYYVSVNNTNYEYEDSLDRK